MKEDLVILRDDFCRLGSHATRRATRGCYETRKQIEARYASLVRFDLTLGVERQWEEEFLADPTLLQKLLQTCSVMVAHF